MSGLRRIIRPLGFDIVRYPNPTGSIGPHLASLFNRLRIDCVLDVGAHWGEYASLLRSNCYKGEILSFEPVSESVEKLRARSARDDRWSINRVALGSREGTAAINLSRNSDLSSFLATSSYARDEFPDATVSAGRELVEVRRLDRLLEERGPGCADPGRYFLKLDTQGWDLEVLAGAEGCLDRILGVQSELSVQPMYEGIPSYLDALRMLQGFGFELTGVFPVQRDKHLRVVELDCVLIRSPARLARAEHAIGQGRMSGGVRFGNTLKTA